MPLSQILNNPKFDQKVHGSLTLLWGVVAIPGVLWWKESVPFLVFCSVYANLAGHWASYQAARAEDRIIEHEISEEVEDQFEERGKSHG